MSQYFNSPQEAPTDRHSLEMFEDYSAPYGGTTPLEEAATYRNASTCPDCSGSMVHQGGCCFCPDCGFEACGGA